MSNFQNILSKKATEIEKPKPAPVGHYLAVNTAMPNFVNIGANETPAAEFTLTLLQPGEDVDADEFEEYGGIAKLKGKTLRYTMWLSEDAQYRATQDLINVFGISEDGKDLGEMFSETVGVQILVEVSHRPSKTGDDLLMNAKSIAAA